MQLTRAADYAVRVMIHMAGLPLGTTVRLRTLALAVTVPESFLAKVLQTLTRAGLVVSRRGPDGGFELVPSSMQASLLDVIDAIEGPAQIAMLTVLSRDTLGELALRVDRSKAAMSTIAVDAATPVA